VEGPNMGKSNGMAIASMVLGIIGLCIGICAPIALILGIVANNQIKKTGQDGKGMALAGIIMGAIGTVFWVLGIILNFVLGVAMLGM
jgi:hypothetical protein